MSTMIATQYEITLPTDYDMGIIRQRVADRGHSLDARPGLGLKAYLIRDVAGGASANAYAPFYLWTEPGALAALHWGGQGFSGIVSDFGRPVVQTWIGGAFYRGSSYELAPTFATKTLVTLSDEEDPKDEAKRLQELAHSRSADVDTHSVTLAIDPTSWQGVIFRLSTSRPGPSTLATIYEVLHLSTPEIAQLA
jgi:hypothetical protein